MAKAKNHFKIPPYLEQTVLNDKGRPMGTLRFKPDHIAWKPKGKSVFFTVSLDKFSDWITAAETKARQVK